jgi:hypothetical protein
MKNKLLNLILIVIASGVLTGCQTYKPTNSVRTIPLDGKLANDAVLEAAIEAAQESNLPSLTKMDKADGIVEFGGFDAPEMGVSAQVRIRPDKQLEIIVKRGSVIFARNANGDADIFRARLLSRILDLEKAEK